MSKDYAISFKNKSSYNPLKYLLVLFVITLIVILTWYTITHWPLIKNAKNENKPTEVYSLPADIDKWTSPYGAYVLDIYHSSPIKHDDYRSHVIDENHHLIGPFKSIQSVHRYLQTKPTTFTKLPGIFYIPHITNEG